MTNSELRHLFLSTHYIDDQQALGQKWLKKAATKSFARLGKPVLPKGTKHVLKKEKKGEVDAYLIDNEKLLIAGAIEGKSYILEI